MSVYLLTIKVYKQWLRINYTKHTYITNSIIFRIIIKTQTLLLNIIIRYIDV